MATKKTDWKKEAARQVKDLPPDGDYAPGTTILRKGTRESVGQTDGTPGDIQQILYQMQRGQWRRADQPGGPPGSFIPGSPVISKTMMKRMRGLFGGGEEERRGRSNRQAGSTKGGG
jgi:hypothetical protein